MRISDWSSDVCSSDLVAREIFSRRNDHRIAPALVEIGFAALGDHGSLQGPERIGVGEIAVVAEQVGDDREAARIGVEQRMIDLDRRAAEQPFLQLMDGRAIVVGVVVEDKPCLLLALGCPGKMTTVRGIAFSGPVTNRAPVATYFPP